MALAFALKGRRPLVERLDAQVLEATEVAVVRKHRVDAVLQAQGGDLRIEDQVAAGVGLACGFRQKFEEPRTGPHDLATRSFRDSADKRRGLLKCGRRPKYAFVGGVPQELGKAKHGQAPTLGALGQCNQPRCAQVMPVSLAPIGVYQHIGVDGDDARSMTS